MFSKTLFWDIQGWSFITYKHTSGDELWAKLDKNWHGASLVAYHIQNKKKTEIGPQKKLLPPPLFLKIWQFIRGGNYCFFFTKLGMVPRWWPLTHHIYIYIYIYIHIYIHLCIIYQMSTYQCLPDIVYIWTVQQVTCYWCMAQQLPLMVTPPSSLLVANRPTNHCLAVPHSPLYPFPCV